jgi:type IV secretion system protein VirB1
MSSLAIGTALKVALACTPHAGAGQLAVSPDVLMSVAYTESALDPFAIHDNATGAIIHPATKAEAIARARRLITAGHRPDLGLMQINAPTNLARTGLTVETAFDACASIHAGAQILLGGYQGGATTAAQQAAILRTFSAYNTGSPTAGLQTYVPIVLASAQRIIPALSAVGLGPYTPPAPPGSPTGSTCAGKDGRHVTVTEFPCPTGAPVVLESTSPDRKGEQPTPHNVFVRPADGGRELVFNGN